MMYRKLVSVLALAVAVQAKDYDVDVGERGLTFQPNSFTARIGDSLVFHFYNTSASHNVVSGSFSSPCQPATGAFYSGTMAGDSNGDMTFTVDVTSNDPIYFYCSIGRHCQAGMVGVVNGPSGSGYNEYRAAAVNAASSSQPDAVAGGVVGTDDNSGSGNDQNDDDSSSSKTESGSRTSTMASTTGSTESSTSSAATTTSSAAASATGAANSAASSGSSAAGSAATTTPSGAGRTTPVVLGLAVVLGGLVALMA